MGYHIKKTWKRSSRTVVAPQQVGASTKQGGMFQLQVTHQESIHNPLLLLRDVAIHDVEVRDVGAVNLILRVQSVAVEI